MTDKTLWEQVKSEYSNKNIYLLDNFRSIDGFNKRLGTWSPITNNSRYYKSLLLEFCKHLDFKISHSLGSKESSPLQINSGGGLRHYLGKIKNRDLGNPTTIKYCDMDIDMDYLLSVEEMFFLEDVLIDSKNILEIGAGFGRLVHSIIQNYPNINKYYVVDLDWMLELSSKFLKKVLSSEDFKKVEFVTNTDYMNLEDIDLVINIDSFQEIEEKVIKTYLRFISEKSRFFYSKNTVCKYHPSLVDIELVDENQFYATLKMGLCREVIDIFDSSELEIAKKNYIVKYCPSSFETLKHQDCFGQYLYYHSVLYKKS